MKVLAIIGSPRKGNTYKIVNKIEDELKRMDEIDFEYLYLKDVDLGQCTGCHVCIEKGEQNCHLKDDLLTIEKMISDADGVIFASPIYTFHVTHLLKTFIDRFSYHVHRPKFFGKKAMIVVTRGDVFKDVPKYLTKVAKSWGFRVTSYLGIAEFDNVKPRIKEQSMEKLAAETKRFYSSLSDKDLEVPSLYDLVWFRIWKLNARVCKNSIPADYDYWQQQGWFDKDYYYDVKVNYFKAKLADFIGHMSKAFMSRIFEGY